ncbi:MAG: hypothetical protein HUJ86_05800, partial [Synergistes sp.]|nr:hypothetical protein [Synergistes sp.]
MSVRDHFIKAASVLCAVLFFVLSPAEAAEKNIFTISVPFKVGAEVTVTTPDGKSRSVAEVKALPEKTRWPSYTASAWSTPGTVCASAVNAIHMLVSSEK